MQGNSYHLLFQLHWQGVLFNLRLSEIMSARNTKVKVHQSKTKTFIYKFILPLRPSHKCLFRGPQGEEPFLVSKMNQGFFSSLYFSLPNTGQA